MTGEEWILERDDIPIGFFTTREDAAAALAYTYGMLRVRPRL